MLVRKILKISLAIRNMLGFDSPCSALAFTIGVIIVATANSAKSVRMFKILVALRYQRCCIMQNDLEKVISLGQYLSQICSKEI